MGDLGSGFWFWPDLVLTIAAIWGVNQLIHNLSLSSSLCNSAFQIDQVSQERKEEGREKGREEGRHQI